MFKKKPKLNILQIVPYFYPAWAYGGPGKIVFEPSKYLALQGHKVTVYTSDAYDLKRRMPKNKHITNVPNFKVHYFRNFSNTLTYKFNIFITPGFFLRSLLDIKKFDVVHMHDFFTLENIWISVLCRIIKKPYFVSVHGCLEEERLKERAGFKNFFLKYFGIGILKGARFLIATSPQEIINYENFGFSRSKIKLIGHGVDKREFTTKKSKAFCRNYFKLPSDKFIATYLGRIHKIKGLDLLIKGLRYLDNNDIFVTIAGPDDGYLNTLKRMVKSEKEKVNDRVKILPGQFGEKKARLLKASDIIVQPSYSEGFSLALLEYASIGKPLVVTKGCHFEELDKRKAGLVVKVDPKSIAEGIKFMYKNPQKRQVFSQNAALLIKEKYSINVIGNRLLNLYRSVI